MKGELCMLTNLKNSLRQEEMTNIVTEAVTRSRGDEQIKSAFLDTVGFEVVGAENDPEIKALVDKLPEYDDYDESVEAAVNESTLLDSIPEAQF